MAIPAEFGAIAREWTAMWTRSQAVDTVRADQLEVANAGQKKRIIPMVSLAVDATR